LLQSPHELTLECFINTLGNKLLANLENLIVLEMVEGIRNAVQSTFKYRYWVWSISRI